PASIMIDLQGPEIRTRKFKGGQAKLKKESIVYIAMDDVLGTAERFSITYEGLINDVKEGTIISIDDGLIELKVLDVDTNKREIKTKVLNSGIVKDKKGVNVPDVHLKLP